MEEEESYDLQEGVFEAVAAEESDNDNDDEGSLCPTCGGKEIDISIPFLVNWHQKIYSYPSYIYISRANV